MKCSLDCIPCLLRQTLRSARFSKSSDPKGLLREVMTVLTRLSWDATPMELGFEVYRVIRERLGDPYAEAKRRSNEFALKLLPRLKEIVQFSGDPLETAVRIAIAGNVVDYGALDEFSVEETVERALKAEPGIYHFEELRRDLERAETVLYFLDNAGEVVFDRLLVETIISVLGPKRFVFVARSVPFINDVTPREVREIGLTNAPGSEVRGMKCGSLSEYRDFTRTMEEWMEEADVVISKGQGNYELLSEYKGIYFLLTVKCQVVADYLGAKVGDVVILRGRGRR